MPATRFINKNSIAVQLLTAVFSIYFVITLVVTIVHILAEYRDTKTYIQKNLKEYYNTFSPALAHAMWGLDSAQIEAILKGMLNISSIKGIKLINEKNEIVMTMGSTTEEAAGDAIPEGINLFGHTAPVLYSAVDTQYKELKLGTVTLYSSRTVVIQRVRLGVTFIIVNALIKTAALWLIFLWVSRHFLSRPLKALTSATREIDLDNLEDMKINAEVIRDNEFKVLEQSFNSMIENLRVAVSIRQQTEIELIHAKEMAETASRAKSEFLSNTSHELKPPMNAIIGMSHAVLNTELKPDQKKYMQKVDGSAKSLLGIINNVLNFSKIDSDQMKINSVEFFLEDVLNNVHARYYDSAQKGKLGFSVKVSDTVPNALTGDQNRLEEVLGHLLSNAIKFTQSGQILLKTEMAAVSEQDNDQKEPSSVILNFNITDTGMGISESQKDDLFNPFTQVDGSRTRTYGGLGLGLALSRKLVELMGGEITVQSDLGKGSTFSFTATFLRQPANKEKPISLIGPDTSVSASALNNAQPEEPAKEKDLSEIDPKKAAEIIDLLIQAVQFDMKEALEQLVNLRHILGDLPEIKAIEEDINDFDDDEALIKVEQLRDKYNFSQKSG